LCDNNFSFEKNVYNTYCKIPKENLITKGMTVKIISPIKGKCIVPCTEESCVGERDEVQAGTVLGGGEQTCTVARKGWGCTYIAV
jgi:hypothetical protein